MTTPSSDALSRRLKRWGVAPPVADRLSRRHFSLLELLACTPVELLNATNRNPDHDRRCITDVVAATRAPTFKSVSLLAEEYDSTALPLSTSLKEVDEILGGGLPRGSITEIVGPPGAGKTQFCMMMAAVAAKDSENDIGRGVSSDVEKPGWASSTKSVAYVDTEGAFDASRWFEIANVKFPKLSQGGEDGGSDAEGLDPRESLGEKVMVYYAPTCDRLVKILEALDVDIVKYRFDLVIVDSIASVVRKEFHGGQSESLVDRAKVLAKQARTLKELAQQHNVPVLVTNQITTHYDHDTKLLERENGDDGISQGDVDDDNEVDEEDEEEEVKKKFGTHREEPDGVVTAALGNSWSHFVNTRIALDFDNAAGSVVAANDISSTTSTLRTLKLLKSSFAPQMKMTYVLTTGGPVITSPPESLEARDGHLKTKTTVVTAIS